MKQDNKNNDDAVLSKPQRLFAFLSKHLVASKLQVLGVVSPSDFISDDEETVEYVPHARRHRHSRHERFAPTPRLSNKVVRKCVLYLDVFASYLGLSHTQTAVLVAILSHNLSDDRGAYADDIESFFRLSSLDCVPLLNAADKLIDKMYIRPELGVDCMRYVCDYGVMKCIMENRPFRAPDIASYNRYNFCSDAALYAKLTQDDQSLVRASERFTRLEKAHSKLKFVKAIKEILPSKIDRMFFCCVCNSSAYNPMVKVSLSKLCSSLIKTTGDKLRYETSIHEQTNDMFKCDLLEFKEGNLFTDDQVYMTKKGRRLFFEDDFEYLSMEAQKHASLIYPAEIKSVNLYYDSEFRSTIDPLRFALTGDNFTELQRRLTERHLPKGVAAIFYGSPGTGKTEMVKQLARETGRAVMHVDISQTKSCFVGESERLVKQIFDRYRRLCKEEKEKPILLFNEADALFSKRTDISSSEDSSVDQMMNAIQNIILEEMEKLDGILIATTNLQTAFDDAFARRFLYKVKFLKPSKEVKVQIWRDKISTLTLDEAETLSVRYDFSGGEIDNIVRKSVLEEVISGHKADFRDILSYCDSEHFRNGKERRIGF